MDCASALGMFDTRRTAEPILRSPTSKEEALRLASDASLDAAILDVNVGGTVVYPVADLLRGRGVPIIFATGYGAGELPPRFGKDAALSKPFSYEELAGALRSVLANRPCHSEAA